YAVTNDEMFAAMTLFAEREGIDIEPAPGVALASLMRAVRDGTVGPDETGLLNVTGGGRKRRSPLTTTQRPALIVERNQLDRATAHVEALFA
ncbi:MAG: cysteate synthase, partial [Candidatus Elarobacter sp.]